MIQQALAEFFDPVSQCVDFLLHHEQASDC